MPIRPNLPVGVTVITPPAVETLTKVAKVVSTDTTAFDAIALPKGAVISGVYVIGTTASDAGTTATITSSVKGGSSGELINAFSVKSNNGYQPVGSAAGSLVGTQLTADTVFNAVYAETGTASTTGGPWLIKVEYYMTSAGFPAY